MADRGRSASAAEHKLSDVIKRLRSLRDPRAVAGMRRFGIIAPKAYGLSAPVLKKIAREIGKSHRLAQELWSTGILDARLLAALVDEPSLVTQRQMERWVIDFDNWAICDCCCLHLFSETVFAWKNVAQWSRRDEEFVKRAGFALLAVLAVHDKEASDLQFLRFLPSIKRASTDERNFVKKAVNWALRQIGKRNLPLNAKAIQLAREIRQLQSPAARWIANDAIRELTSPAVKLRLRKKHLKK